MANGGGQHKPAPKPRPEEQKSAGGQKKTENQGHAQIQNSSSNHIVGSLVVLTPARNVRKQRRNNFPRLKSAQSVGFR